MICLSPGKRFMKKLIILKKVKIKHRLPAEVVQILRSRGSVLKSKKDYNRKQEKIKLLSEVRECGMKELG